MVDCHGSQCGFCTPGFVMSLFGLYKNACRPSRAAIEDALSGNLCRCTGYRPIVAAAQAMYDSKRPRALAGAARASPPTAVARRRAEGEAPGGAAAALARGGHVRVRSARPALVGAAHARATGVDPGRASAMRASSPAPPTSGLWVTKHHRDIGDIVYTGDVAELRSDSRDGHPPRDRRGGHADRRVRRAGRRVAASCTKAWARFASVPIRNSGTLGGNVANGSPIGDSMPALMALGATVVLRRGDAPRASCRSRIFYLGYRKNGAAARRIRGAGARCAQRTPGTLLRAYKVSKRYDQDISAVFVVLRADARRRA